MRGLTENRDKIFIRNLGGYWTLWKGQLFIWQLFRVCVCSWNCLRDVLSFLLTLMFLLMELLLTCVSATVFNQWPWNTRGHEFLWQFICMCSILAIRPSNECVQEICNFLTQNSFYLLFWNSYVVVIDFSFLNGIFFYWMLFQYRFVFLGLWSILVCLCFEHSGMCISKRLYVCVSRIDHMFIT
jgi:hypothetical protein